MTNKNINVEFTTSPNSLDLDFLTQKINEETPDFGAAYNFAFFIRDDMKNIIAGCNGFVIFESIYTDQLWVDKKYRRQGFGQQLMNHVHAYGRTIGCRMATVNTMSFQTTQAFYKKLGYEVDFERRGYAKNSCCLFLIMKLS